ncbi:hypothetical protein PR001_g29544 [Phytophthora rubi]|uniref:Tc1-like transposase DDE domain-containing protein n=1 Tax=Phytophthora rubi TaxID=129364 RepID=A0A6A3H0H4_9STRA|nr:hypothetical protein PR001_g29544 [Phytophthora rubi]
MDDAATAAALRTVQRFVTSCGCKRGKRKGSTYRLSVENEAKRDSYVQLMTSESADHFRTVYLDESYIHHNYSSHNDSIYDPTDPNVIKEKHKGRRFCFIAAIIDKNRTLPDAGHTDADAAQLLSDTLDIFEGGKQTKDYHGMFNHDYFKGWIETLLAGLEARNFRRCRIVMDNAKYHKKLPKSTPRKGSRRSDMHAACKLYGISYTASDTRAIMWEKLSRHIVEHVEPEIVSMAKEKGHEVVFTPPHYSDLQPIEYVWANIKGEVGRQYTSNTTFQQVRNRLDRAFENISSKTI